MRAAASSSAIATASRRDATRREGFRPSPSPRHRRWTTARNHHLTSRPRARRRDDDRDLDFDPYADDGRAGPPPSRRAGGRQSQSSWTATEKSQDVKGVDYLVELGKQSSNTNTEVGARKGAVDYVFAGTANATFNLGADSDIASGRLRYRDEHVRSFKNLVGDFHVPPLFVDKVSLHVAKNLMADAENPGAAANPLGSTKVPLILGVWGAKGCGKTFNLELACKALDITPVVMSAGELEDEWAGNPGRLVRSRYRKAAEIIRNHGKMSCLIINDIDAGVGRFKRTQATVNTQMVMGTLMNLCDHPTQVSNEEDDEIHEYREEERIRRVPIIVTGNDLSTLYAPLLRDGRMEKFYWQPTREDIADMVHAMYRDDDVSRETVERLVARHEGQARVLFTRRSPCDRVGAAHAVPRARTLFGSRARFVSFRFVSFLFSPPITPLLGFIDPDTPRRRLSFRRRLTDAFERRPDAAAAARFLRRDARADVRPVRRRVGGELPERDPGPGDRAAARHESHGRAPHEEQDARAAGRRARPRRFRALETRLRRLVGGLLRGGAHATRGRPRARAAARE
jgi:hypothetical protein